MTYTISADIRQGINSYLTYNVIGVLVNDPLLGRGTLTPTQLTYRLNYTAAIAVAYELGGSSLNGYKRSIVVATPADQPNNQSSNFTLQSSFTADGGDLGPFTHVLYISNANLIGANDANGNNRGDSDGRLLLLEEVDQYDPLTISSGITYNHSILVNVNCLSL